MVLRRSEKPAQGHSVDQVTEPEINPNKSMSLQSSRLAAVPASTLRLVSPIRVRGCMVCADASQHPDAGGHSASPLFNFLRYGHREGSQGLCLPISPTHSDLTIYTPPRYINVHMYSSHTGVCMYLLTCRSKKLLGEACDV